MKSKTMYRIELREFSTEICNELAVLAAKSNGSDKDKISLAEMNFYFNLNKKSTFIVLIFIYTYILK